MGWAELYVVARAHQHGAFAVRDAPRVGLTVDEVRARARREGYERPHPGIIVVPGYATDHRTFLAASQLHLGASAAASDLSAAWLYGLVPRPPVRPHLLLPHAHRPRTQGVVVHRSRFVEQSDRTTVDGISVLRLPFMLVAIAPRTTTETLYGLAIDARQRRLLETTALATRLETIGAVPGRRRVERVLADLLIDGSDSVFESRVRTRLRAAGLHPTSGPYPVSTADGRKVHLDIAFPAERVAIECHGHLAHHTRRQLDRDARRDNAIALVGDWVVLKLTWDRYTTAWDPFLVDLRSALTARGLRGDHGGHPGA